LRDACTCGEITHTAQRLHKAFTSAVHSGGAGLVCVPVQRGLMQHVKTLLPALVEAQQSHFHLTAHQRKRIESCELVPKASRGVEGRMGALLLSA
jgi:glycine cleavage system protein P-like pyridoxal-binding family